MSKTKSALFHAASYTPHKAISAVRPTVKPEKMDTHRSLETAAIRAEGGNHHADRILTTNYQDPPNQSVTTNLTSPCQIVDTTAFSHHLDLPLPVIKPLATSTWQDICHNSQFMQLSLCINTYLLPTTTTAIV